MIVVGSILTLALFVFVGWAVSAEMFQHRAWRRRVESGDIDIVGALIEEALATWRRARPPKGTGASLWSAIQGAQLIAVAQDSATLSTSADPEFRSEGGRRVQVATALDSAVAAAAKLTDMIMYDVPNLRLGHVRVDVYSTFTSSDGAPVQQPILTTTADRHVADELTWEALTPAEILGRFETIFERSASGQPVAITLPPFEGTPPKPTEQAAAEFAAEQEGR
ncbi:MAG: hypothetical protein LC118_12500 [Dehalococcoidia bacterium]|nr:hypothetical protein [Dehalococcoidia bacterium]